MGKDPYSELERLWALKESGGLTDEEFLALKMKLLGGTSPQSSHAAESAAKGDSLPADLPIDPARSKSALSGCGLAVLGGLFLLIVAAIITPENTSTPSAEVGEARLIDNDGGDEGAVSRTDFQTRGLTWPLTVEEGRIGCTRLARWVESGGVRYGLNGSASKREGYADLSDIWALDEEMAEQLRQAGVPNDPPLRINVGDMIEEAGKFC